MKVSMVRHGKTEWGLQKRTAGLTNIPIDPNHISEIIDFAQGVKSVGFDFLVSSPMLRTVQTAEIIGNEIGLPLNVDPRLAEFNYGNWEGLTIDEIRSKYQESLENYFSSPSTFVAPGGARLADHESIVSGFMNELIRTEHRKYDEPWNQGSLRAC